MKVLPLLDGVLALTLKLWLVAGISAGATVSVLLACPFASVVSEVVVSNFPISDPKVTKAPATGCAREFVTVAVTSIFVVLSDGIDAGLA